MITSQQNISVWLLIKIWVLGSSVKILPSFMYKIMTLKMTFIKWDMTESFTFCSGLQRCTYPTFWVYYNLLLSSNLSLFKSLWSLKEKQTFELCSFVSRSWDTFGKQVLILSAFRYTLEWGLMDPKIVQKRYFSKNTN